MKTPEEIKNGLNGFPEKKYETWDWFTGIPCKIVCIPVREEILDATRAYIQQLESRLTQVERERDALMRDLRDVGTCEGCIHDRDPMIHDSCIACRRCHPNDSDGMFDHWQWRGVCPENMKEEGK